MAHIETPAPAESMAVLETSEFPGNESTIACARLLGSSDGTLDANRAELRETDAVGSVRGMMEGRSRQAPVAASQDLTLTIINRMLLTDRSPSYPRCHDGFLDNNGPLEVE